MTPTPTTHRPVSAPFTAIGVALIPAPREWWRGGLSDVIARRRRHRSTAVPLSN